MTNDEMRMTKRAVGLRFVIPTFVIRISFGDSDFVIRISPAIPPRAARTFPADGGAWIEDNLRAIQAQRASAFGKVPIVADVDADSAHRCIETWITEVARLEVILLPKPRLHLRDVRLSILAEILAVRVDHGGGV